MTDQTSRLKLVRPHAAHPAIKSRCLLHKTTTHKEVIVAPDPAVRSVQLSASAPLRPHANAAALVRGV